MRVATWNINGLRARMDLVLDWLQDRKPDLVGLQELKMQDEKFPHDAFEAEGYKAFVHGQKAWNGVAVLCRREAVEVRKGIPGQEEFGSRLISVKAGDIDFITIYGPNGKSVKHDDYPRKLAWFDDLARLIGDSHDSGESLILCGDFNICPAALDSWDEEGLEGTIFHTEEERARYRSLLDWGFVDLFRDKNPEARAYSWWDYRGGSYAQNQGLRIDLLLGTGPVSERTRGVVIDRDYREKVDGLTPSDHVPVIADLS